MKIFRFDIMTCCAITWLFTISGTNADEINIKRPDGSIITAYLDKHATKPGHQLLLNLQGSTCNSVANKKRIKRFFQVLPEADFLTIEKYGITSALPLLDQAERPDCPKAYLENDTPEQRVKDAIQILNHLKKTGTYKRFVVQGGSEGAFVAGMLAARLDYIDAAVLLNHGGALFKTTILYSIENEIKSEEERNEALKGFKGFVARVLNGPAFDFQMSGHAYNWWKSTLQINLLDELMKTQNPVFLVQTLSDINTSPIEALKMWSELKASGKTNITTKSYKDLDHVFINSNGQNMSYKVIEDIKQWLKTIKKGD